MLVKILKLLKLYPLAKVVKNWLRLLSPKSIRQKNKMMNFYSQFLNQGDLCFDIGANLGNRTEIFLKLGAKVVAVDPQEFCVKQLQQKYKNNSKVIIIQQAVGSELGNGEIMVSNEHAISSMSRGWIESVQSSGRFSNSQWSEKMVISITTLDGLIQEYGNPVFCKIDVEGFEFEVLKGLSQPIKSVSFEFTPEYIDSTVKSIKHLIDLGTYRFNYSIGESMELSLSQWVESSEILKILTALPDKTVFGDVYAKLINQ